MSSRIVDLPARHNDGAPFAHMHNAPHLPQRVLIDENTEGADVVALACRPRSNTSGAATATAGGMAEPSVELVPEDSTLAQMCDIAQADVDHATGFAAKAGQIAVVRPATDTGPLVLAVGVGQGRAQDLQRSAAALSARGQGHGRLVTNIAAGRDEPCVRACAVGFVLGSYVPSSAATDVSFEAGFTDVVVTGTPHRDALDAGLLAARGTVRARELCAMPSSIKTPSWMVEQADLLTQQMPDTTLKVWTREDLEREGFGGITAVGQGAEVPPTAICIDYAPANAQRHVVLIGKGVTFDTGGLSLKPSPSMELMRTDMSGSAVVMLATYVAACAQVPVRVTCLAGFAENSVSSRAFRPSDVITTYDGSTVEVSNTDAEGRMVLCDLMGYAVRELRPDVMVDVATLTGAATLGVGRTHAALFASCDDLADDLVAASRDAGEPMWRMPLVDDYTETLESVVADLNHIPVSGPNVGAGAITAALFLRHFHGDVPWAHLDIAGVGRATTATPGFPKGPTAFGVRALATWLGAVRGA